MSLFAELYHCLHHCTYLDYIEIIFFSTVIYGISSWLKRDQLAHLLVYWYGYCALLCITYIVQLQTIFFALTFFSPVIAICSIIMHQTTLQKQYVMLKNPQSVTSTTENWIEQLLRINLQAMHTGIRLHCIIEQSDSLRSVLFSPIELNTPLHSNILEMLIKAPTFKSDQLIWLNAQGILIGVNAQWHNAAAQHGPSHPPQSTTIQEALLYTAHTDALFFSSDPVTNSFTSIVGGKIHNTISAHTLLISIKKYLYDKKAIKKGDTRGTHTQRTTQQEHHS